MAGDFKTLASMCIVNHKAASFSTLQVAFDDGADGVHTKASHLEGGLKITQRLHGVMLDP